MKWEQISKEYGDKHRIDGPHGWIQWKGTRVCMDIRCECGYQSHLDAEFAYMVRCPSCKAVYHVSPYVHLERVDVDESDDSFVEDASP